MEYADVYVAKCGRAFASYLAGQRHEVACPDCFLGNSADDPEEYPPPEPEPAPPPPSKIYPYRRISSDFADIADSPNLEWWHDSYLPIRKHWVICHLDFNEAPNSQRTQPGRIVTTSRIRKHRDFFNLASRAGYALPDPLRYSLSQILKQTATPDVYWITLLFIAQNDYPIGGRPPHLIDRIQLLTPSLLSTALCDRLYHGL